MFRLYRLFSFGAALMMLSDCASPSRIAEVRPLLKDLPSDLQSKFEVGEPSVTKSATTKTRRQKAKTKGSLPFVYPSRRSAIDPIWIGEKQVLEVTYLGLKAGDFTTEVLPLKQISGRTVYPLRGTADSSTMMNLFYRLNDTIESFWDYDGLFSYRFHLLLDQTKQKRDSLELYDSEAKKVIYWNRSNHVEKGVTETKEVFDMVPFPQDSLSALFYVRTLPLQDGKTYTFPVASEGKGWDAVITVVRREMMDTPLGRKMCVVIRPQTSYQGAMKQENGESFIWLTDDDRRFIVRVEAQVKIGAVAARMVRVELGEKPNVQ